MFIVAKKEWISPLRPKYLILQDIDGLCPIQFIEQEMKSSIKDFFSKCD